VASSSFNLASTNAATASQPEQETENAEDRNEEKVDEGPDDAAPKGGSGKTTLTALLAAKAAQDGQRVALIDLNADQASLTDWWTLRGEPENPQLFEVDHIARDIDAIGYRGFDWLFIDTAPLDLGLIEVAVKKSDAAVVPVRASHFDLIAITPAIEICENHRRPFAFVQSVVDNRAQAKKLNETTATALATAGPVFTTKVLYDVAHISALPIGKVGFEIAIKLQPEADALWSEVKSLAASTAPIVRRIFAND
jgi:chromosome partitioning protein